MSERQDRLDDEDFNSIVAQIHKNASRALFKGLAVAGIGGLGVYAKNSAMFSPRQSYYLGLASYGLVGYGALATTSAGLWETVGTSKYIKDGVREGVLEFNDAISKITDEKTRIAKESTSTRIENLELIREELQKHYDFLSRILTSPSDVKEKVDRLYNEAMKSKGSLAES